MGKLKNYYIDAIDTDDCVNEWEEKLRQSSKIMKFIDNFQKFNIANPEIFHAIVNYSDKQRKVRNHYSIENIIGTVRYYTDLNGEGDPFKINNNYKAYYSRMYMQYRDCAGFFELRNSLADDYDFTSSINEYLKWKKEQSKEEISND